MPYTQAPVTGPYPVNNDSLPPSAANAPTVPHPPVDQSHLVNAGPWGLTQFVGDTPAVPQPDIDQQSPVNTDLSSYAQFFGDIPELQPWEDQSHLTNSEPLVFTPYSQVATSDLYPFDDESTHMQARTRYPPVTIDELNPTEEVYLPVGTADTGAPDQPIDFGSAPAGIVEPTDDLILDDALPDLPPQLHGATDHSPLPDRSSSAVLMEDGELRTPDLALAVKVPELRSAIRLELDKMPELERPRNYIMVEEMDYGSLSSGLSVMNLPEKYK
ncbi:hypothetical protein H4R34_005378, partial [Dimargaris verticillata]